MIDQATEKIKERLIKEANLEADTDGRYGIYPVCPICGSEMTMGVFVSGTHFVCKNRECGADITFLDKCGIPIELTKKEFEKKKG